ncbi:gamma-glutamyltransferase [Microbacterium sp. M3]|uniref:Gamma-glutamyltransferase n=1 Tax=Microbacterium arthrosphaerae TaxID=792652 RepID=A0ABU4H137_9MICO|nr:MULTISPECIES: gamma-glutamyltransferase [Microbacterium]MDW4573042.1 gamma-glutamyltransferase [Microbacterium arthrosphaerae]MDW7606897.1 gamma-glutamyltransferase [Microbacterium sp. M3]
MTYTAPGSFTTRPTLAGTFGMSASTHWLATATSQSVLERGGNAFDAAVAAAFVLHVVEPHLNGPGGDLVGIFQTAGADATPTVLMGQGPAPAAASIDHYRDEGLELVPGAGGLAAAVPGAVDAWLLLLRDHGTWELADVLAYAIGYAREGHPLVAGAAATIARVAELFRDDWPTSAALWMPAGEPPVAGRMMRNPAYADVLDGLVHASCTLRDDGPVGRAARIDAARREWKTGVVAHEASAFLAQPHRHSGGGTHAAVITPDDFAGFEAGYEAPVTREFRGRTIAKPGAWTQGPALLQTLGLLEPLADDLLDPSQVDGAHTILEAQKLAYADRDAWFGDDDVDLDSLLSPDYLDERRSLIGATASAEFRPGSLPHRTPYRPPLRTEYDAPAAGTGEPTVAKTGETRGDTCHLDVIDRWGNIVSATPSGGWLQSSPAVPALGFCLGTRLQMTWLEPGHPSSLVPGRRPRTTLTPTLVLRDGAPEFAIGSPGGDQQDQWQLLALLRIIVGGYTPQAAIDAPALHTTSLPESFWPRTWTPGGAVVEDRLGDALIEGLERRGHVVTRAGGWSLGRVSAVGRDAATGVLWAAANPRGMQGYAAGR